MKTKFLAALAITALLFASCSDDNDTPEVNDGRVKFSSGINGANLKVGGTNGDEWTMGDPIGIYMIKNGEPLTAANIMEDADNVGYKAARGGGSTGFSPVGSQVIYYPVDETQKVEFFAYHPYQPSLTDFIYSINLMNQSDQSALDLMIAKADNSGSGYDKINNSAVDLKFNHQLAKVFINVLAGDGVSSLDGLTVNIKGMNATADFDLSNPSIANEGIQADIIPYKQQNAYIYEAILLPVVFSSKHIVEFNVGGNTYKWNMQANSGGISILDSGNKYTFDVRLQKGKVLVNGSILPWLVKNSNGTAY